MADNLKDKTVRGMSWSLLDNLGNQGITFLVGLVLARLLTPTEYGIIGIITIFIALFNSIVDAGFSNALIQKKNATNIDYNTVFIINTGLSFVLCIILFFCAKPIALFFKEPTLIPVTQVMSTIIIINAFGIVQKTILTKQINFKLQTKVSVTASVLSGIVGIIMALTDFGVWSLVGQQISKQLINAIMLWILNTWKPTLQFSMQNAKSMFSFGWKLLATTTLNTLWQEIYQVVIGKFYPISDLGQYTRGKQFCDGITYGVLTVIQRVTYPILSSIQDEEEKLRSSFIKITSVSMFIMSFILLTMAAVSHNMIVVLIGEKWLMAASLLQLLCFSTLSSPLNILNQNILLVKARTHIVLNMSVFSKIISIFSILAGIFISIDAMLIIGIFNNWIIYTPLLIHYSTGRYLNIGVISQFKMLLPSFLITGITALITASINFITASPLFLFVLQILTAFISLIVLSELFHLNEYMEIKRIIFERISKRNLK